jgi:Holliday junction DNA helicase RuvB
MKKDEEEGRPVDPAVPRRELRAESPREGEVSDNALIPDPKHLLARSLEEVIGQTEIVRRLRALVELARRRREVLGHLLFVGQDGCGKRMMAHAIARELGVNLRSVSGFEIERAGDIAQIVNDLDEGDVLFIENVDRSA